jgi:hypothetical protein
MKTYGVLEVQFHTFVIPVLDGSEWAVSRCCRFTPVKSSRYPLNSRMEAVEQKNILPLMGVELRLLGRPILHPTTIGLSRLCMEKQFHFRFA